METGDAQPQIDCAYVIAWHQYPHRRFEKQWYERAQLRASSNFGLVWVKGSDRRNASLSFDQADFLRVYAAKLELRVRSQISIVARRDGVAAAREYAVQTLRVYRSAAQFRDATGRRHFAHDGAYRKSFVAAICAIREYLRNGIACD